MASIIRKPDTRPIEDVAPLTRRERAALDERGSMTGTIVMVVFSLLVMGWVMLGGD